MDIKDYFKWNSSEIPVEKIMELTVSNLDSLYCGGNETEGLNVFFYLLNEYIYLKNLNARKETAHICYLISYYLFVALTPPCSERIAMEFAEKAVYYNDILDYHEWIKYVKRGN